LWGLVVTCHTDHYYSEADLEYYWCAATGPVPQHTGYYFGGLFTAQLDNPVTNGKVRDPAMTAYGSMDSINKKSSS
jgi:hypothetical protein